MVEAEGLKEKIKTSKTSSSTSVSTISSMLFGNRSAAKSASSAPAALPSDCFDYTAESRLRRNEAQTVDRRESSGSGATSISRRLSGAKSSANSPTARRKSAGASGSDSSKGPSAQKKPPALSEYEKQIMSGMASCDF